MIVITEKEWRDTLDYNKQLTPLTKRRQLLWNKPTNPHVDEKWITEGIDFIVLDKEGSKYENNANN